MKRKEEQAPEALDGSMASENEQLTSLGSEKCLGSQKNSRVRKRWSPGSRDGEVLIATELRPGS